ncbi:MULTISPECIES: hypothetical protein [unclassified Pseudomonas]|uniref:hypothetical protein n=1 Tax=unclassified Pseudomonas TaxID=196821 RepID=UPI000C2FAB77|nr:MULTISPECIES: hypothetical protein [unclassified Pseudomonas]MCU1737536.1 hypothetical protein [Pseudomonas sp. 20S_6.2_Bac1]
MDLKNAAKAGAKSSLWAVWHVIMPVSAMRRTLSLTKREIERNKENVQYLKELSAEAKRILSEGGACDEDRPGLSFEEAMAARSADAPSMPGLYRSFLIKKRWALLAGVFFALTGLCAVVGGLVSGHPKDVLLGAASLLVSQPVFFMAALEAQLRLWQLKTKRLSVHERGGVRDFMVDYRDWFRQLINPEINWRRRSKKPSRSNGRSQS